MTGYGRSQATVDGTRVEVEIRSVNHKFCEISMKLPKPFSSIESQVKKRLQKRFPRGRLDLLVTLNGSGDYARRLETDLDLASQYRKLLLDLKKRLKLKGEVDLAMLTTFRNFITVTEKPIGSKRVVQVFYRLLDLAVGRLEQMRRKEGKELARDLLRRLRTVKKAASLIKRRAPHLSQNYQRQLQARVQRCRRRPSRGCRR